VDLVEEHDARRILDGHLGRPAGTGTLLVASANLDHITYFSRTSEGAGLPGPSADDWLVLLDGGPLVWAAKRLTGKAYPRLAGADLLPAILTMAEARGSSAAILGGAPDLKDPLTAVMRNRWPGLSVVAHLTPPRRDLLDDSASRLIQAELASLRPDLLVVCLGKPLQESWMAQYAPGTGARVAMAFGAAIDFVAGSRRRAPRWMRDHSVEWLYRLALEPRRMSRRYLVSGPCALAKLLLDQDPLQRPSESASGSDEHHGERLA